MHVIGVVSGSLDIDTSWIIQTSNIGIIHKINRVIQASNTIDWKKNGGTNMCL